LIGKIISLCFNKCKELNVRLTNLHLSITMQNFVSYIRVSTQKQGDSGLGLEAQTNMIANFVRSRGVLVKEFVEIASGTKKLANRPQLKEAIEYCRKNKCALVFGKLDRLARNVSFFLEVIDNSKVTICFADMPDMDVESDDGRMFLINMANFAEYEARRIGRRTKEALAVVKSRGVKLGVKGAENIANVNDSRIDNAMAFAEKLCPIMTGLASSVDAKGKPLSLRGIAKALNDSGSKTANGKDWTAVQVTAILKRLGLKG
jgi:DNA invertase Pin-like site-specific DNA recombinase